MTKISILEVKEALKDKNFKASLPSVLHDDLIKYESNPNCPCNLSIYRNILKHGAQQLRDFYPNKEVVNPDTELPPLQENNWQVIDCKVDELESKLKSIGIGRVQLAVARWEDKVVVIVNHLDVLDQNS